MFLQSLTENFKGLHFASEKCVNFAGLALVDDDIYLDVPKVTQFAAFLKFDGMLDRDGDWTGPPGPAIFETGFPEPGNFGPRAARTFTDPCA